MPSLLSDAVIQHAIEMPQMSPPHDLAFPCILDAAISRLQGYPSSMLVQFQHALGHSPSESFGNITGFLTFAAYSAIYRLQWLLEDVVSGLNENRPMRAISAARGILETSVTIRRLVSDLRTEYVKMSNAYQNMIEITEKENFEQNKLEEYDFEYQKALHEAIEVLSKHSQATRINWSALKSEDPTSFDNDLENVDEDMKQKNVLTLLAKYSSDGNINKKLKLFYALQCDYTHPNRGAHQLVTEWSSLSENIISYMFSVNPEPDFGLRHSIRAIFTPLSIVIPILMDDIGALIASQQDFLQHWWKIAKEEEKAASPQE